MHNAYIGGSLAAWTNHPVSGQELWYFDLAQFKAINGDEGGAWAPAAAITIGGAGITLQGANHLLDALATLVTHPDSSIAHSGILNVYSDGRVNCYAGAKLYGTLTLGTAETAAALTLAYGSITLAAGTSVTSNAATAWGGTYTLSATADISSNATTDWLGTYLYAVASVLKPRGSTVYEATSTIQSDPATTWLGTYKHTGTISLEGGGHINIRSQETGDASETWGINDCDVLIIPSSITGAHNYKISNTGAVVGKTVIRVRTMSAIECTLLQENGDAIINGILSNTVSGRYAWTDLLFRGTNNWQPIAFHKN